MKKPVSSRSGQSLLTLFVLFSLAFLAFLAPSVFRAKARNTGDGLFPAAPGHSEKFPNYDVRTDKDAKSFRSSMNRTTGDVAAVHGRFARGESGLRAKVPTLKVERGPAKLGPEVIAPDVSKGRAMLTRPSAGKRSDVLKGFLKQNADLVGTVDADVDDLKIEADYANPDGELSFVELTQDIDGIPVFQGSVKAGFTKRGEIVRVVNNLAPGLDKPRVSRDFGEGRRALAAAARHVDHQLRPEEAARNERASVGNKEIFGDGDWSPQAEKVYFPTEAGVVVPAWQVLIVEDVSAYYIVVDAQTGELLWRKALTQDQTLPATYDVYANPLAMINVADSPAPMTPGPINPALGTQGNLIGRTNVIRVGNEGVYAFNSLGWVNDGNNTTDGNNVESGIDRDGTNGVDPGTQAAGNPGRVFSSTWNPPPGNPAPGDDPLSPQAQRGAVIQQFYIMNWYHDELYRLGFTEAAHNFQTSNFGRGGVGGDRISAEGQDLSGFNNANFFTAADGVRGRMQMYLFSGPTPDRDGTTDADIMIHEATHGTSNRLHGNGVGLSTFMAGAMGEGWGDFYAFALLSQESDPIDGVYAGGGYSLLNGFGVIGTQNYYYGIRRFPKAIRSSVGGPNNRPHNPLTFADIDSSTINTTDGAFPAMSGPQISTSADQVHAGGEIWSTALWEVRGRMIARLGWETGNRRVLQVVTDGMKLAPINPTFLQERDAIIAAALGSSPGPSEVADAVDVWTGFAIRGMGVGASIQSITDGQTIPTRVTESFEVPRLIQYPTLTVSDGSGDGDGVPEPGETLTFSVPLANVNPGTASSVTLQIAGGGSASYGTMPSSSNATRQVTYTVPAGAGCGTLIQLSLNINSSLGAQSITYPLAVGAPTGTFGENFDTVPAPAFPAGWTASPVNSGVNFVTSTNGPDSAPNAAFALDPTTNGGGTNLTSPVIPISTQIATVSFRNKYETEAGWDGGVLEISIAGGPFQDIIVAGGMFLQNGYNGTIGLGGVNDPIAGRPAWSGESGGYLTSVVRLPASAAGQGVQLRWRFGADSNTALTGWWIDTVVVSGNASCSFSGGGGNVRARADFDGDGRTDISVFRPSEGNWYLNRSRDNIAVMTWGFGTDIPAPADYDGDRRADIAVFRPTASGPTFYIVESGSGAFVSFAWGVPGDVPVPADYDGDGRDDAAVFRPSENRWYIRGSRDGYVVQEFGQAGDVPVRGDFDGDGRTDISVYRGGQWWIKFSSAGVSLFNWGFATDKPVVGDYDGDGTDDIAVYRPSEANWYIRTVDGRFLPTVHWGAAADVPVPGDYDGDRKADPAVYRNGIWYTNGSTVGFAVTGWGVATDVPLPAKY